MKWVLALLAIAIPAGSQTAKPGKSSDAIVLSTGETLTGEIEFLDAMYVWLAGSNTGVERPRVASLRFHGAAAVSPAARIDQDLVILRDGRRSPGRVSRIYDHEIIQPAAKWKTRDVAGIWLAPGRPGAWAIKVSKSGGFMGVRPMPGRGAGDTDGYSSIAERAKAQPGLRTEWLQKVEDAIRAANPSVWSKSYVPPNDNGCCDRFNMTLTLQLCRPDGSWLLYSTRWYSGNPLPRDLEQIYKAADSDQPGKR